MSFCITSMYYYSCSLCVFDLFTQIVIINLNTKTIKKIIKFLSKGKFNLKVLDLKTKEVNNNQT